MKTLLNSQAGISQILVLLLLVGGIGLGTYLVQQRTNLKPKAQEIQQASEWEQTCPPDKVAFCNRTIGDFGLPQSPGMCYKHKYSNSGRCVHRSDIGCQRIFGDGYYYDQATDRCQQANPGSIPGNASCDPQQKYYPGDIWYSSCDQTGYKSKYTCLATGGGGRTIDEQRIKCINDEPAQPQTQYTCTSDNKLIVPAEGNRLASDCSRSGYICKRAGYAKINYGCESPASNEECQKVFGPNYEKSGDGFKCVLKSDKTKSQSNPEYRGASCSEDGKQIIDDDTGIIEGTCAENEVCTTKTDVSGKVVTCQPSTKSTSAECKYTKTCTYPQDNDGDGKVDGCFKGVCTNDDCTKCEYIKECADKFGLAQPQSCSGVAPQARVVTPTTGGKPPTTQQTPPSDTTQAPGSNGTETPSSEGLFSIPFGFINLGTPDKLDDLKSQSQTAFQNYQIYSRILQGLKEKGIDTSRAQSLIDQGTNQANACIK